MIRLVRQRGNTHFGAILGLIGTILAAMIAKGCFDDVSVGKMEEPPPRPAPAAVASPSPAPQEHEWKEKPPTFADPQKK